MFTGLRNSVLWGEFPFDSWMVVRYPSHRKMLKMISNPYYVAVCNPIRKRAVAQFELAFTKPRDPDSGLQRHRQVLAFHVEPTNAESFLSKVRALAETADLPVVYESVSCLDFDFISDPAANDPQPLTWPVTAALATGSKERLREFAASKPVERLLAAQKSACAVLYDRADKLYYLKFGN